MPSLPPAPEAGPSFAALGVARPLLAALAARGIEQAFPIQAATLPDGLAGRDVLGRGRTGSGKTVAFALPVIERVLERAGRRRPHRPRALVLVPTRELAVQVADTVGHLAGAVGLTTMTVFGGVRYTGQVRRLERGVDIVIATPGRLEDLLQQGVMALDDVAVAVLDEADLMADMGFLPPVTRLLEALPPGQRLLFSATLDGDVAHLVERFLTDPAEHAADEGHANPDVTHHLFVVTMATKRAVLDGLVRGAGRTMLFARTKTFAERLATELADAGVPAAALHGDLRQAGRQRNLASFADGSVQVLVATDIAARGIHVDGVGLVVHVDPPVDPKAFLHRSGRTARAGAEGLVLTLATRQQLRAVRRMMTQAGIQPVQTEVAPGDPIIASVRAPRSAGSVVAGPSIFEPDPDDAPEERTPWASARPPRGPGREPDGRSRPERPRRGGDRSSREGADARRQNDRPWREDRVRRADPRSAGGAGPVREGQTTAGRPPRAQGPHPRREAAMPRTGWGAPRPAWRRPDEGGAGRRRPDDREERPIGRGDDRRRPDDRATTTPGRTPAGPKGRWSDEDRERRRRTAAYLAEHGLGGHRGRAAQAQASAKASAKKAGRKASAKKAGRKKGR